MSFSIVLQTNNSEKNKLTKTLDVVATLTGTLRSETSIIDPVIIVEASATDISATNYCTIATFGRSYFVKNVRSIRNGLWELTCHVDVLTSFKSEIKANSAIIKRQQYDWNLYLNDGSFKIYQNPTITTHPFPSGFSGHSYILAVAGS